MVGTWAKQRIILRNLLREMRDAHGLTQAALARCLDKPQSYVSKIESGERRVDFIEVRKICTCCGDDFVRFVERFEKTMDNEGY